MKIKFIPAFDSTRLDIDPPQPCRLVMPAWYKKLSFYRDMTTPTFSAPDGQFNLTSKACVPMMDVMSFGYVLTTPCDLEFVDPDRYGHRIIWKWEHPVVTSHSSEQIGGFRIPGFESRPLKMEGLWRVCTPSGYSVLFTHPWWHWDLPFLSAAAVVDADRYRPPVNVPFFVREGFIGTVPKGTPYCQLVPFRRERWSHEVVRHPAQEAAGVAAAVKGMFTDVQLMNVRSYRRRFWSRKEFG